MLSSWDWDQVQSWSQTLQQEVLRNKEDWLRQLKRRFFRWDYETLKPVIWFGIICVLAIIALVVAVCYTLPQNREVAMILGMLLSAFVLVLLFLILTAAVSFCYLRIRIQWEVLSFVRARLQDVLRFFVYTQRSRQQKERHRQVLQALADLKTQSPPGSKASIPEASIPEAPDPAGQAAQEIPGRTTPTVAEKTFIYVQQASAMIESVASAYAVLNDSGLIPPKIHIRIAMTLEELRALWQKVTDPETAKEELQVLWQQTEEKIDQLISFIESKMH